MSLCNTCLDKDNCPMPDLLAEWEEIRSNCEPMNVPDDLYQEHFIERPEQQNGAITWCPMYVTEEAHK